LRKAFLLAVGLALLAGCGTTHLAAPDGVDVVMLRRGDSTTQTVRKTQWVWLFGAKPITDPNVAPLIQNAGLREVRFTREYTFVDSLLNIPLVVLTMSRYTVSIEGNR